MSIGRVKNLVVLLQRNVLIAERLSPVDAVPAGQQVHLHIPASFHFQHLREPEIQARVAIHHHAFHFRPLRIHRVEHRSPGRPVLQIPALLPDNVSFGSPRQGLLGQVPVKKNIGCEIIIPQAARISAARQIRNIP